MCDMKERTDIIKDSTWPTSSVFSSSVPSVN